MIDSDHYENKKYAQMYSAIRHKTANIPPTKNPSLNDGYKDGQTSISWRD